MSAPHRPFEAEWARIEEELRGRFEVLERAVEGGQLEHASQLFPAIKSDVSDLVMDREEYTPPISGTTNTFKGWLELWSERVRSQRAYAIYCVGRAQNMIDEGRLVVVSGSASGRALLADLEKACGPPPEVGFEHFVAQLELRVSFLSGRLVDRSDPELVEAARSLSQVPKRLRHDSLVTVIVLLDEWSARASQYTLGQRALEVLRQHSWSKEAQLRHDQVAERFPFLAPAARGILESVGVPTSSGSDKPSEAPAHAPD